jgi:hypothetical protein
MQPIINLEYKIEDGQIFQEPHKTNINRLDQIRFLEQSIDLFKGKDILEMGCGDAYIRELKQELGFMSYTGIDKRANSNANLINDFNKEGFRDWLKEIGTYGVILAFQTLPEDIGMIQSAIDKEGSFIHHSGTYMFQSGNVEERIAKHFRITKKQKYKISIIDQKTEEKEYEFENIFVVGQKL